MIPVELKGGFQKTGALVFVTSRQEFYFLPTFIRNFLLDLLADSLRCLLRHYLLILPFVVPAKPHRRGGKRMHILEPNDF